MPLDQTVGAPRARPERDREADEGARLQDHVPLARAREPSAHEAVDAHAHLRALARLRQQDDHGLLIEREGPRRVGERRRDERLLAAGRARHGELVEEQSLVLDGQLDAGESGLDHLPGRAASGAAHAGEHQGAARRRAHPARHRPRRAPARHRRLPSTVPSDPAGSVRLAVPE
jgi:hypothetical protein